MFLTPPSPPRQRWSGRDKGRRYGRRRRQSRGKGGRECSCWTFRWSVLLTCHQKEDGGSRREVSDTVKKSSKNHPRSEKAPRRTKDPHDWDRKPPPANRTSIRSLSLQGLDVGSPIGGGRRQDRCNIMYKHQISSKWGEGNAGTSTHAAVTGRALPHPNRYRRLRSKRICRGESYG